MKKLVSILLFSCLTTAIIAQKPRARDLGIPFTGKTGPLNAITDVKGIEVGHSTIIEGSGKNIAGKGPVRTGVTAIFPRGKKFNPVYANWYSLNGNGEMVGTTWITESGFLETPIMITNTNSVGVVRDAVLKWYVETNWYEKEDWWYTYPVVAETYDGFLNDIYGFHVQEKHVLEAIENAQSGRVEEGNVGGGTGMMCLGFKGGIGTASRVIRINEVDYTLGVLVQSNFGARKNLTIAGVPVGMELMDTLKTVFNAPPNSRRQEGDGSIIVIVATDAPLLPHQLKRLVHRVPLGIGAVGGYGSNGSGDIFLAFSTANEDAFNRDETAKIESLPNDKMTPLFAGTAQAVEEAIINAMIAAETMEGNNGNKVHGLPHHLVQEVLKKYNRFDPAYSIKQELSIESFPVDCSIRAITAVDENTMWYGGSRGQFGYTENGGKTWRIDSIQTTKQPKLEFRGIAKTKDALFLLAVGSPALLFKSVDKGKTWQVVYEENHPKAFYDAIAFWDDKNGIAMGDPTDGCLSIIRTKDSGNTWTKIPCSQLPPTAEGEAAFAASNSNIVLKGNHVWIVSGGEKARVFHSANKGESWKVFDTPIAQGGQMTGIFTTDFYNEKEGVIFGGNWEKQAQNTRNKAVTKDGGKTWHLVGDGQHPGYRSSVQYVPNTGGKQLFAVGIPGLSYSADGGQHWTAINKDNFYTIRICQDGKTAWLAGMDKIGRMTWSSNLK